MSSSKILQCSNRQLDLGQPQVMGVLNVTPDSFSDGGKFCGSEQAVSHAKKMVESGAAIIDVGGESTRPGAAAVSLQEELDRVLPIVEALSGQVDVIISVDTSTPKVMTESVKLGAGLINDVRALQKDGALQAAALAGVPVCLMHMQGRPETMQNAPQYSNVIEEVVGFFELRIKACVDAGITTKNILLDPGFGFGKKLEHNLQLLKYLKELKDFNVPLLVGMSRKTMIGEILSAPVENRLVGSVAAALIAVTHGADIVRVHDVQETVDALNIWRAMRDTSGFGAV